MRIFLSVTKEQLNALENSSSGLEKYFQLEKGAWVWGVPSQVLLELKPDDQEEKEFEALQEAVLITASKTIEPASKVAILAVDVAEQQLLAEAGEYVEMGHWFNRITAGSKVKVKAVFISELSAKEILTDEYAPEMLWFDPSEIITALEFLAETPK